MDRQGHYEYLLNQKYNGTVRPIERYINQYAVIKHECSTCGMFYSRPKWLLFKDSQKHVCNERLGTIENIGAKGIYSSNHGKIHDRKKEEIVTLYNQGFSMNKVAMLVGVDRSTVSRHLKKEGLR